MKVPTEKFVPTVRIEVEFPAVLIVSTFEPKRGWTIEGKKDALGKLVRAVLTGSIPTATLLNSILQGETRLEREAKSKAVPSGACSKMG